MKNVKKLSLNVILIYLLSVLVAVAVAFGVAPNEKSANAMKSYPYNPMVAPLYDYNTYCYSKTALDQLAGAVLNNSSKKINDLVNEIKTTALNDGKPVTRKDITVSYGRYRLTGTTNTSALVWMPVYMSTSRNGHAILTLYLAATNGPRSGEELGGFTNVDIKAGAGIGQYATDPELGAPSNMYGTSYMRIKWLGAGGEYAAYNTDHLSYSMQPIQTVEATASYKFMDFVPQTEGTGTNKTLTYGYLYEDIASPSEVKWQSYENYKEAIGNKGVITDGNAVGSDGGGPAWANYCFINESYDAPKQGSYNNTFFDAYKNKNKYSDWSNDKLWLPSLSEVGTGDNDGTTDTTNGLWKLTANQRGNTPNGKASWLRTANTVFNAGDSKPYNTYSMFAAEENGTIKTHLLTDTNLAIRPAIHLDLDKALEKLDPPVVVPATVKTDYNGDYHTLSDSKITIPATEAAWFVAGKMHVEFFSDVACEKGVAPINAGEYYMRVTLDDAALRFVKAQKTQRTKVVKFLIEKAKLSIKWTYDSTYTQLVKSVALTPSSVIYEIDKKSGNVPQIGIRFKSTTGSNVTFYAYEDLLRGTYKGEAYIIDENKYNYNYRLVAEGGDALVTNSFAVGRKTIQMPYFIGHSKTATEVRISYAGYQYIQIADVGKYIKVTAKAEMPSTTVEELGLSDEGYLTFKVSAVDKYTFTLSFLNNDQFTWPSDTYDFAGTGKDDGADFTPRKLVLNIDRAKVDVNFDGLPAEWNTISSPAFSINVKGIYNPGTAPISFRVYYQNNKTYKQTNISADANGVYTLKNVPEGEYTMSATMNDAEYLKTYYMDPAYKTQVFKVIKTVSAFSDNDAKWQYNHDGTTSVPFAFHEHAKPEDALVFNFDDKYYVFSLSLGEQVLLSKFYVKAVYSGDTYTKNAGLHSVKVTVTGFYKNVEFTDREYVVYFKILPQKYDISTLAWDYDPNFPLVYDGAVKKVRLTADSLAAFPGLTADYTVNGDAIAAGNYTSTISFKLAEPYATNYVLPVNSDTESYIGTFPFTCDWIISKAKLAVEWKAASAGASGLLFVPTLQIGHEYVDYVYERKSGGDWVTSPTLTAAGAAETFRAKAVIKAAYAKNYELDGNIYSADFLVESGKRAISVHFERNGKVVADGDQIPYSGAPVNLTLKVDGGGLAVKDYTFEYYSIGAGNTRTRLVTPPGDIGSYCAVVSATYSADTYISDPSTAEVAFEIVKADYDLSQISWLYKHGSKIIAARYDKDQNKWVDDTGKEVLFAFEYDGTEHKLEVVCHQEFANSADALKVLSIAGNTATDACEASSPYTAVVSFEYNTSHFNNPIPAFPKTLNWQITKRKIDFSKVRWGYVDADGKEHDFNFDDDAFEFKRDENGVVGTTVALIGLPKGMQDLITYKTQNTTVKDSILEPGNERMEIGEYLTTCVISGTWSDPNHETYDSADFTASGLPATIPAVRPWQIKRKTLTKLNYKGGFPAFDNKTHNLIELCNMPEEELVYYNIEVTFIDSTGKNVRKNYPGYEDVANMLFHAGTYDIRFYELVGVTETPMIWDAATIQVAKGELNINWDVSGSYPIARVLNIYATDMISTKYFNANDAEVPIAYVKSTNGEEDFFAKACVSAAFENDIKIIIPEDELKKKFTYQTFSPSAGASLLTYPTFVTDSIEYTGAPLTFVINGWETQYSKYLYLADGVLTQTDVGEYRIMLRFLKDADAYWKERSTANDDEYNRDAYVMTFRVAPPTKWALEYPNIDNKVVEYTGENIEFKITNWVALNKYLTYEVFYNGESLGKTLTFKNGGIYTVVFTFPQGSIGYWKDDVDDPHKKYSIQLNIFGDPNVNVTLTYPELDKVKHEYTGDPLQFRVKDWDIYFSKYLTLVVGDGVEIFDGGVLKATSVGNYTVTFKIKEGVEATFDGGLTEYTLTFSITTPEGGGEYDIVKPNTPLPKEYTGAELEFQIDKWNSVYKNALEMICVNPNVKITEDGKIKVTNVGKYVINLKFKDGSNAYWKPPAGSTEKNREAIEIVIEVLAPAGDGSSIIKPTLKTSEKKYNGTAQVFEFDNFNPDEVAIVDNKGDIVNSIIAKDVGEYSFKLRLKNAGKSWFGGGTDDIEIVFKIVAADVDHFGIGKDAKPIAYDKDGNPISGFDASDIINVKYFDESGKEVAYNDLKKGVKYFAEFTPKDEADFDKKIVDGASVRGKMSTDSTGANQAQGKLIVDGFEPAENGSSNLALWLGVGGGALGLLLLLAIVIVLLVRRNGVEDEDVYDDYSYDDDGGEEEDDYDEEEDDYDEDY